MKFLLQQRRWGGRTVDYVDSRNGAGATPLFCSIDGHTEEEGVPNLVSPKVVQMLMDAGADTSSAVRVMNTTGQVTFNDTLL